MGGCQTATDYTQLPKAVAAENKFKQLVKHQFNPPSQLSRKLQSLTSNGKITDYITKTVQPLHLSYQEMDIKDELGSDGKFEDKQFKPTNDSIGKDLPAEHIEWKRPEAFMKDDYKVFEGTIEPLDIKQGKLGNCYLLSSLTAISEYPFIIKRIFETTEPSSYGFYGIWLFIDGLWRCVILDDYFPLHANRPIYSRNHQNELWVMLIEKAYAKVYGSYQNIESGLTGIAMNAITGAPYQYLCKSSSSKINSQAAWDFITQHIAKNHLLTGSTENNDRNEYLGLVQGHAYTIIDVQEVHISTKKGKKKEKIIKLSNPWGKYEWKGRWSEYSDVWSQELREQLHYEKADDGLFWINIEDFVENFGQICVCKYNKNFMSTSLALNFDEDSQNGFKGIFLSTKNKTQGSITLIQQDFRIIDNKAYEYSPARVIVLKMQKNSKQLCQYIADSIDCDRDASLDIDLEAGDYYILVEMDWKNNFTRKAVLNFYGQHPVAMAEDREGINIESLYNEIVFLHEKYTESERIYEYAKDSSIKRITGSIAGYVYYHYSNKSHSNNYLCETVSLKERKFILVDGQKDKEEFTVKVYPNEQRIVRLKVQKQGNSFYSFSTKIQFYIVEKYSLEKLRDLADKKPSKVKKREIEGKEIEVRVKTYNYSGGIVMLYQNKMDKYAYIEEITFEKDNLELENEELPRNNKLEIQLEPQTQKLLSFVVSSPGKEVVFRTKMSFYLNSPEFKF